MSDESKGPQAKLAIRYMKTAELQAYERNPVIHSEEQVKLLANAIERFGFNVPIAVDSVSKVIIAGHGRLLAARKLKRQTVPVVELGHLTPQLIREYRIADNQLTRRALWDYDLLTLEVNELKEVGGDLQSLGFTDTVADMILAHRYHEISCGHRVVGHESKCQHLHGHNYRVHFALEPKAGALDALGRVLDFGVMREVLCDWLEREFDHRLILWENDPWQEALRALDSSVVLVPFNPTAENLAIYLLTDVVPRLLNGRGARCIEIRIEETTKCHASARLAV